jgi:PIN domain nuclease of toxin-antitoxin system
MANCPNCKARLSCGCQKRVASNKAQVCASCITAYELKLKQQPKK